MDFKLPELGEGVYEAEAVRWLVQQSDTVKPGQPLLEVLTDKATMEVPAPFGGVISKLLVEPGQKLEIGQAILQYEGKEAASKPAAKAESKSEPKAETKAEPRPAAKADGKTESKPAAKVESKPKVARERSNGAAIKAAPSVRLMARKLGVDLAKIHGSGPSGRILIDDLAAQVGTGGAQASGSQKRTAAMDFGKPGTKIPFAGVRRKIAEHMVDAKTTIPHYTYVDECDFTDLVKMRESLKETFAAKGTKLSYLPFVIKAVVQALREVPIVNASLDEKAGEIVLHDHYHVGIAVATPGGLIVPVVRDADKKSLAEMAREIDRLTNDARQGKQHLEDLRGGTFTVTSIGNIGGLFATPIIPPGQLGIVGVGKIVKRPVFDERGNVKPADLAYLSFSFDHRVLDGAVGAAFGNAVIHHLQNPALMLLV